MKRSLLAAVLALSPLAEADFIGLYGGLTYWDAELAGTVGASLDVAKRRSDQLAIPDFAVRNTEADGSYWLWAAFEHPIPLLPNIRAEYLVSEHSGTSQPCPTGEFDTDILFDESQCIVIEKLGDRKVTELVTTTLNLDVVDLTAYYEVLDNWVSLDLGLTVRMLQGDFIEDLPLRSVFGVSASTCSDGGGTSAAGSACILPAKQKVTPIDFVLPLLYAKAEAELPFTGFYASALAQGISDGDNSMKEVRAELGYTADITPLLEIGATLGYRYSDMNTKDLKGIFTEDAKLSGLTAGFFVHF
jgi:outer membrane protein